MKIKYVFFKTCPKTNKIRGVRWDSLYLKIFFPLIGLSALIWFLIRVLPKPSRASYPCQQVAAPFAFSFFGFIVSMIGAAFSFKKARQYFAKYKYHFAVCFFVLGFIFSIGMIITSNLPSEAATTEASNKPIGIARGINPGRVVWTRDSSAVKWDGTANSHWWDDANNNQVIIDSLLSMSIKQLIAVSNYSMAWDSLFHYFNRNHGKGNIGYQAGEKIVIKINQNTARNGYAQNGSPNNGATNVNDWNQNSINGNPQLIKSLLYELKSIGVSESDITVYDAVRTIPDNIYVPNHSAFPGVHFMDNTGTNGREKAVWTTSQTIFYAVAHNLSDRIPQQVVNAKYVINMAIMKNHGDGPTLSFKNHYGSINGQGDHNAIYSTGGNMNTYSNLVDLGGHKDLGEKTVLFLIDALYGGPSPDARPVKWSKWSPFNGWWPASVFASQDGVALESVGFDIMNREWSLRQNSDNFLHEAALADNPPSGTKYAPNGDGIRLKSLGVHEHWNNSTDKKYSRNFATGNGIELVYINLNTYNKKPVANFSADKTSICTSDSILITNLSQGNITSYQWNFGVDAVPLNAVGLGPHRVKYTSTGDKTVTLTVSGANGDSTMIRPNYIHVGSACPTQFSLKANQDSYIRSGTYVDNNFGNEDAVRVKNSGTDPTFFRHGFILFDLTGIKGTVSSASIKLFGSSEAGGTAVSPINIYETDTAWNELTITWNNAPALKTSVITATTVTVNPQWYSWDITSFLQQKIDSGYKKVSFRFSAEVITQQQFVFNSSENTTNPPVLEIKLMDNPTSTFAIINNQDINIYPNPVYDNNLTIELPGASSKTEVTICNLQGGVVFKKEIIPASNNTIHLTPSIPSGIYIMTVKNDDVMYTKKIAVQRF